MARWRKGEKSVGFLVSRGRLESFEAADLAALAEARVKRAALRLEVTATAAVPAWLAGCEREPQQRPAGDSVMERP